MFFFFFTSFQSHEFIPLTPKIIVFFKYYYELMYSETFNLFQIILVNRTEAQVFSIFGEWELIQVDT